MPALPGASGGFGGGGNFLTSIVGALFGGGGASADPWAGLRLAGGGRVSGPGGPTGDKIPAMLSDGEHVTRAAMAKKYAPLLAAINADRVPHLASGGRINAGALMEGEAAMQRREARGRARALGGLSKAATSGSGDSATFRIVIDGARGNQEIADAAEAGAQRAIDRFKKKEAPAIAIRSVQEYQKRK